MFCCPSLFFSLKAQTAYIQVTGEPDLMVYLNGEFKGKTSVEFNGLIIEQVKPGKNLIKVIKQGYVPYKETIDVKNGEVLAYKVKPFTKHVITISEQGNTEATDKKGEVPVGKLVVQSVPIEIKITIQGVEGASMVPKKMDQWKAENIPAGNYTIQFFFNNKKVEQSVEIVSSATTRLFVNMITGAVTVSNSLSDEEMVKEIGDSILNHYWFQGGLTVEEFERKHPEVRAIKMNRYEANTMPAVPRIIYSKDIGYYKNKNKTAGYLSKGFYSYTTNYNREVIACSWILETDELTAAEQKKYF